MDLLNNLGYRRPNLLSVRKDGSHACRVLNLDVWSKHEVKEHFLALQSTFCKTRHLATLCLNLL